MTPPWPPVPQPVYGLKRADKTVIVIVVAFLVIAAIVLVPVPVPGLSTAINAAIGPFIGAGLAFLSAMYIQGVNRERDHVSAGNLALLTISAQYNDFVVVRKRLREVLAQRIADSRGADIPLFLLAPSIGSKISLRMVDFKSLAFLFDTKEGIEAYPPVLIAEQHYESLFSTIELMSEKSKAVQAVVARISAEATAEKPLTEQLLHAAVGLDVMHQTADYLRAVVVEIELESIYRESFDALRAVLAKRFEDRLLPRLEGAVEGAAESDLPPLPKSLQEATPAQSHDRTR